MHEDRPFPEPLSDDFELNACSTYDCTGLIPALATEESEIESYEELYPYLSPEVKPDKNNKDLSDIESNA